MRYLIKIVCITIISVITVFSHITAQVTIGSNEPPAKGALLDLKEGNTTTKGIAFPRVKLISLKIPHNKTSLASTIQGASGEWNKDIHIGLSVYNSNKCVGSGVGVYVWDGNLWQFLGNKDTETPNPGVSTVTDHEGNIYTTAIFGSQRWMTQNLRATTKLDGTPIKFMINGDYPGTTALVAYPGSSLEDDTPPPTWNETDGILYTGYAFFNTAPNSRPNPPIRGLCPQGWHVPSSTDFVTLLNEIKNNYQLYTYSKDGHEVDVTLATGCKGKGLSKPATLGGFDDQKVGIISSNHSISPINATARMINTDTFYMIYDTRYYSTSSIYINGGSWFHGDVNLCNWCGIAGCNTATVRCIED